MKTYLAYSMADYGSGYTDYVKEYIGGDIVDPADYEYKCRKGNEAFFWNMQNVFYPLIDSCDRVVYVHREDTGNITSGVRMEIKHAKSIGKDVVEFTSLGGLSI